jgi:hypothetical protein
MVLSCGRELTPTTGAPANKGRRKQFFFEKKNQKTFTYFDPCRSGLARQAREQKFFGSFIQKRTASLLRPWTQARC